MRWGFSSGNLSSVGQLVSCLEVSIHPREKMKLLLSFTQSENSIYHSLRMEIYLSYLRIVVKC